MSNKYSHLLQDCVTLTMEGLGFMNFNHAEEGDGFELQCSLGDEDTNFCEDLDEVDNMMACWLIYNHLPELVVEEYDGTMSIHAEELNMDHELPTLTRNVINAILAKKAKADEAGFEAISDEHNIFLHLVNDEKHLMGVQMLMELGCPMKEIKEIEQVVKKIWDQGWEDPTTQDLCDDLVMKTAIYQRDLNIRMA